MNGQYKGAEDDIRMVEDASVYDGAADTRDTLPTPTQLPVSMPSPTLNSSPLQKSPENHSLATDQDDREFTPPQPVTGFPSSATYGSRTSSVANDAVQNVPQRKTRLLMRIALGLAGIATLVLLVIGAITLANSYVSNDEYRETQTALRELSTINNQIVSAKRDLADPNVTQERLKEIASLVDTFATKSSEVNSQKAIDRRKDMRAQYDDFIEAANHRRATMQDYITLDRLLIRCYEELEGNVVTNQCAQDLRSQQISNSNTSELADAIAVFVEALVKKQDPALSRAAVENKFTAKLTTQNDAVIANLYQLSTLVDESIK